MGRPDLTEVRSGEILDAFARCVARYGLEGSSLRLVAAEAGVARSIIRHYIGNRDDLIHALANQVVTAYREQLSSFQSSFTVESQIDDLMAYLFPTQPRESTENVLVVEALIAAGEEYPKIRTMMRQYVDDLVTAVAAMLRHCYPRTKPAKCWQVAYGLVSICFNQESLSALSLPRKYLLAARACARALISSIADDNVACR